MGWNIKKARGIKKVRKLRNG